METIYNVKDIINEIEKLSHKKSKCVNEYAKEYIFTGPIGESTLEEVGFVFIEYSSYIKCPVYKLGNIVAIYNENVLHIIDEYN